MNLIVESMDFDSVENKIITENVNGVGEKKFYITGIHMQSEVKNGNGRIYPKAIIEREVKRINESKIKQSRFTGELNHPSCHTETAKILTSEGWKYLKNINEDEQVYTLNIESNEIELQSILKKIDEPYKGKMFRVKLRNLDTTVTPNHRFLTVNRYGKYEYVTAQELYDNPTKYSHSYIPKLGTWYNDNSDEFILEGLSNIPKKGNYNINPESTSKIDMTTFVRFLGIWLAEGHVGNNLEVNGNKCVVGISQKDETIKTEIRELLKTFPEEMQWKEYTAPNGTSTFILLDYRLAEYLRNNCGTCCYDKRIPKTFKNISSDLLEELLVWFQKGDGRCNVVEQECGTYTQQNIFTTSEQLIHDLNEILFKSGGSGNITTIITEADYIFADRLIKAENKVPLYQLNFSTTKGIHLDKRFIKIEIVEDYDDNVYCVSVPNQNFYCMDNGKTFWSGNSCEINPERISHITKELRMEGNDVYGKSLVLDTPMGRIVKSLMEGGVRLGVSSRGVGTLKESVVQNDFQLHAIDVVTEPSAPNAFVEGIMESKKEWVFENGLLTEKELQDTIAEVNKVIVENQFSIEDRQAAFLKLFQETMNKISNKYK